MLQKIHWLEYVQSEHIHTVQECRTLFCKQGFPPHLTFLSPAFAILRGGLVSNSYAWTLVINNRSIITGGGSAYTPVDDVSEQIRQLMILRMNLFFGQSPEEIERCYTPLSVGSSPSPSKILPDVFGDTSTRPLYEELESFGPWLQKVLSLPRQKYCTVCQALAAYERALHVLSSDHALSYALLVFAVEALANGHEDYHATWDDVPDSQKKRFDTLFEDERIASTDPAWADELRQALVDTVHPGATKRFIKFALAHIPDSFYAASSSSSKLPLRSSRIAKSVGNAYALRSSFSHALEPLTQSLIYESCHAEEVEESGITYPTLRGLFRLVRSILLAFIDQQETVDLSSHPWIEEVGSNIATLSRVPAYTRMKDQNGQLYPIRTQYAKIWFEDILQIYQDNYVECLHKRQNYVDWRIGVATSGSWAGRFLFRFDPTPSYDWRTLREQSLSLIGHAKKPEKAYLQAIALLCTHLLAMDEEEGKLSDVIARRDFGEPLLELQRFVVDVIHGETPLWSAKQAEKIFEQHLKNQKNLLPSRVEAACMLELAKLFRNEGLDEGRKKWLNFAYGDTAMYPNIQDSIRLALDSDAVVEPQDILFICRAESDSNP